MTARPVVVLDDDPTGTQCAADVTVLLDLDPAALSEVDLSVEPAVYALTNTRALDPSVTRALLRRLRTSFTVAGNDPVFVLRGDSTLRGHVAVEMAEMGLAAGVGLVVPAYPAAGRVTVDSVHWVKVGSSWINVADTEFAADPVFGFRARNLPDWLVELGVTSRVRVVSAHDLARHGRDAVAAALRDAEDGAVVVPDVRTDSDIATIAEGYWAAVRDGRPVITRCAAPLAALLAGRPGREVTLESLGARRILVVCGSHTAAATRQLGRLTESGATVREVVTDQVLGRPTAQLPSALGPTVEAIRADLHQSGLAVVATERLRRTDHHTLADGAAVMAALMAVVAQVTDLADLVVTKGGITSAEVATSALRGRRATVRGQVQTGVSLFEVTRPDGGSVRQIVVPGNLGEDDTLSAICTRARAISSTSTDRRSSVPEGYA